MELSDSIKSKLSDMAEEYKSQLPDRYDKVLNAFRLASMSVSVPDLNNLRLILHKLAGSGATFGFDELSIQAKKLVRYLDFFLRSNTFPSKGDWDKFEKLLLPLRKICIPESALEELDELEEVEDEIKKEKKFVFEERGEKKIVNFISTEGSYLSELTEQLGYYGYTIEPIAEIDELDASLKKGNRKLLLLHTNSLKKNITFSVDLKRLKDKYGDVFSILYISDSGDFSLRMAAIRTGADAYFVLPLDIGRLVDKMDSLITNISEPPFHILLIDDDPEQIAYYAFILQQAGMITSVATDPEKVLQILVEAKPEIILMDMYMPVCTGTELAAIIRQQEAFVNIPIIFLSVENNLDKKLEAYRFGADGFLSKPIKPEHLLSIIRTKAERNRNLRFLMERDSLTGLLNHSNLKENITLEILRAKRVNSVLCFAMIDVDHFKNVNDTYGHPVGDRVLKSLARLLQDRLRRTDIIGRYGGEEFGIILLNTDGENAKRVMDEVRENFSRIKHKSDGEAFYVTFSCGIACFPSFTEAEEMNAAADKALYSAKESGRNKTVLVCNDNAEK